MPETEGVVRPLYSDVAVLEAQETRKEIPCTVTPVKPVVGFDLRFHAGYDVTIPLKSLEGSANLLTTVFRVVPAERQDGPAYFSQSIQVPEIREDAKGDAYLEGDFDLGEGKYHVSWLMRDRSERVCSSNWDIEAVLPAKDKALMPMKIAAANVEPADKDLFKQEDSPARDGASAPLSVKVMVNFAPQDSSSASMQPADKEGLMAILRNIAREPRIGKVSLVAFNVQEERIVYRQDDASQMDFPSLGDALQSLVFGTVKIQQLVQKHSGAAFLGDLMTREIGDAPVPMDAVVITGPKALVEDSIPADTLKQLGDAKVPVFYLNYIPNPAATPWRDAIGGAVRVMKGVEYTISRPRDLFAAWSDIMGRIMKLKAGKSANGGSSSQ
jgi:hypothetical protein